MEINIDKEVLAQYHFEPSTSTIKQIGSGHINQTYLLTQLSTGNQFIVQSINANVFTLPDVIANNISAVAEFLSAHFPHYLFPAPIKNKSGNTLLKHKNEFWRVSNFIANTIAPDTLNHPKQAYEAAKQFGKLSKLLNEFNPNKLKPTIVGFHDLNLRYEQFLQALHATSTVFKEAAKLELTLAKKYVHIVDDYKALVNNKDFPDRVMHHDTKISNVLLHKDTFEGVCVIDLDTLMPGKFISDLGDMMRTYLCEFSENETDLSKIKIRKDYFVALVKGYLSEMGEILSPTEKNNILYSGKFIIYMQALRFLTDYLNGSVYYPINYATQNLDRAKNQFALLEDLFKKEDELTAVINDLLTTF